MTTLSTLFHLNSTSSPANLSLSHTSPQRLHLSCSFKPKTSTAPPARDRVIDFGKHKGKMLGILPSNYLKWVSKNLRARDFEDWAKLADQVLADEVYRDRMEWELAENLLNGNRSSAIGAGGVSELLEMSEKFGWDNDDKVGWSKVKFELLGTSRGGRIPRLTENNGEGGGERELKREKEKVEVLGEGGGGGRRRERRLRLRMKREGEAGGGGRVVEEKLEKGGGTFGNRDEKNGEDWMVDNSKRFPGREGLLKKAYNTRMKRFP